MSAVLFHIRSPSVMCLDVRQIGQRSQEVVIPEEILHRAKALLQVGLHGLVEVEHGGRVFQLLQVHLLPEESPSVDQCARELEQLV